MKDYFREKNYKAISTTAFFNPSDSTINRIGLLPPRFALTIAQNRPLKAGLILKSKGYIVELEGIGFFSISLSSRPVMDKSEIRSKSIHFRNVNFRYEKYLKKKLKTMRLERMPETKSTIPSFEERLRHLTNHLNSHHFITCGDYRKLTGCSKYRALQDLNKLIDEGKCKRLRDATFAIYRGVKCLSVPLLVL